MATPSKAGGRASWRNFQANHTIPKELFLGADRPKLIKLLQSLPDYLTALNLDSPDNLQPLPSNAVPDGSAVHYGSHPGMTSVVKERLDSAWNAFYQANKADIDALNAGSTDPATQARVRTAVAAELRGHIEDFQFKTTNFMDVGDGVGRRMIFNSRDLAYLQTTPTWAAATPAEKAAALRDSEMRTELIRRHNRLVAQAPLDAARELEQKVLRELGDGTLMTYDGKPATRDAIRAFIADAGAHGVNLNNVDARVYMQAMDDRLNLNPQLQTLNSQIDNLTAQLATAPPSQRSALLAERATRISERFAIYEAEIIGSAEVHANANVLRRAVAGGLTSGGRAATALGLETLKRIGFRLIPVVNVLDTAMTIYAFMAFTNEMGLRYSPNYRGAANGLHQFLTGRDIDLAAYARFDHEGEAIATVADGGVIVYASRLTRFQEWTVYIVNTVEAFGSVIQWSANQLLGALITLTGDQSRRTYAGQAIQRNPDGSYTHVAAEEQPIEDMELSIHLEETTTLDAGGNETGSSSSASAVQDDRRYELNFAGFGAIFGSNLARLLHLSDPWAALAASTVLSQVGRTIGAAIDSDKLSLEEAFRDDFPGELADAGIGAVSSYLFAELVNELGLTDDAAAALSSTGGAAVAQIAINLRHGQLWNKDLTASMANAAGAFVGSWLASQLVEFDTIEGQIGAALGSSIGAYVGISAATGLKLGGTWGNIAGPIGALVGAFVGYILGGVIGSLFAATPKSGADLAWDASTRKFGVAWSWARGGASRDTAVAIAQGAGEALNAVIATSQASVADARSIRVGAYGTHEKNFVFRITDASGRTMTAFKARDVQQVLNYGLALATADLLPRLVGGNVFVKRALLGTFRLAGLDPNAIPFHAVGRIPDPAVLNVALKFDINALLGNMNTALDYTAYLQDARSIRAIMAQEPDSAFTSMWTVTLARAWELGLHRRAATDWTGGWNVFMDEALGGTADGTAFSPSLLEFGFDPGTNERLIGFYDGDGTPTGVLADTIDTASKDHILGTDAADTITVATDRIANTTGLTIKGEAATGAAHIIKVAARIEGGLGNDTIIAGDLGNDLLGGDGNDTLVGGKLDDWLLGDAGNDRLFAGAANYQFTDGNVAATAAALNTTSNGDMLDGGDGDDALYGSLGSDWLRGGAGVDTIYGGAGGDIIDGGAGNDQGAGGAARLFGGGGTDQYVCSYGSGIDVLFDESDNAATPGSTSDSLYERLQAITGGTVQRNWAGDGSYEVDGSVKGGEDAIAFGIGIGFDDLILQRSGTTNAPGQDLIIYLTAIDPVSGQRLPTGDQLIIKDWFETTRRVEWLRFADGQEIRIGDVRSFIVGTGASDVIFGTNAADFIVGDSGNNVIRGLGGDDFGFAGAGDDMIAGDGDNDLVTGGDGNDSVLGGLGNDTAFGDAGNDRVYGGGGSDLLAGGRGDDEIIGGDGGDIIRFERGDGRDVVFDALVNNWELVWQAGTYVNGYTLNTSTGVVTKNGEVVFNGEQWIGTYDYVDSNQTFSRHLGAVAGVLAGNSGTDFLEFGIGIDIQDLMLRRTGSNLEIAITTGDADGRSFDAVADRITIRDWYLTGNSLEYFVFAATGRHDVFGWTLSGLGTEGADTIVGTTGVDWITGNAGDDVITGDVGADILAGNGGSDTLRGGTENDVLFGGAGDDVLEGGAGADQILGGTGVDIASYASASPTAIRAFLNAPSTNSRDAAGDVYNSIEGLEGTAGTDRLGGDDGANILRGLGGNDTLFGGAGDDVYEINNNNLQDTILDAPFITEEITSATGVLNTALYTATWTHLGILATPSNGNRRCFRLVITRNGTGEEVYRSRDTLDFHYATTTSATMPLPGGPWPSSNGQLLGGATVTVPNGPQFVRDIMQAGDGGSDTIEFGTGILLSNLTFQRLNGNADLRITYTTNNYVTITEQNDPNRAIETMQLADGLVADLTRLVIVGETATANGDLVVGDTNANTLDGLGGDDVLSGGTGTDTLRGGDGDDILEGGAHGDVLDGGNDSITAGLAPSSTDHTEAYGDTIRYVGSTAAVTIDLAARTASGGHAAGDTIVAVSTVSTIENVVGSSGWNDTLRGDARANRLSGLGGNDTLEGRAGEDVLVGGAGDDTLRGGDGDDNVAGEDGNDIIEGGNQNDLLAGGSGVDQIQGDAGEDVLSGGDGDDTLRGGTENDRLGGDTGNDQLFGDAGNDQLVGGDGNDTLTGGDGDDILAGEQGNDQLLGEIGNDTYVFDATSGNDTIVDASGLNCIAISGATAEQIWLTRSGNDLRIGVIGGSTSITVQNYYAATTPTRMREVALQTESLFLAYAEPLIQAMTLSSATVPAQVPQAIADTLSGYWHEGGRAAPSVGNQTLATNEDTVLSGTVVGAVDHDENIVSYTIVTQAARGVVAINTASGAWTYAPHANLYGPDSFVLQVNDADGNAATQTVTVNVASVNDAPSGIAIAGGPASIDERDHPITGTVLNPVVLGTLSATDVDAPDPGDFASHVFSVSDSRFEIVSGNVLRLRAGAALDFEASPTVTVAVTVTDRNGAGLSFTQNFTYAVNNRDDYFYGTAGNDTITGQAGRNLIYGQGGNDTLTGANANDDLDGGDGADNLFGQGGNDTLLGGLGDDVLDGGSGVDTLRGGDGVDTLRGQDGADQLFGDAGNDLLQGGLLNDQLDGGADNDRLEGGDGADTLTGGTGDDTLIGGTGADTFLGGSGVDTVSYETATAGVTVNVTTTTGSAGDAAGDVFSDSFERIVGSGFNDTITGSAANETLEGGAGNDTIYGGAGNDALLGGDGNDTLDAQSGNDMLNGGAGTDILIGGDDSDTYLLDINSGADEIRNFDPNGTDIDVVGYQGGISHEQLWFQRSGDDLVVYVVGTSVQTTIKNWYLVTTASERANYQIDFFLAGERVSDHVNAEALVTLMAGYTRPTTQAAYDTLRATPAFGNPWNAAWNPNAAPVVPTISNQTINEDGTLTLSITITDDFTPAAGISVTVQAVRTDNPLIEDLTLVNAPTISAPNGAGARTLTVTTRPNRSGQVNIKVTAVDGGGVPTERLFLLTINAVADTPTITVAQAATPTAPLTKPTLDSGWWALNLQAALVDQDGSETLEVRIANVPSGITFNAGTNLGSGVWSFTPAQLSGLRVQGPATWSQDLALSITAISRETATGLTATSAPTALNIVINARPTDIFPSVGPAVAENAAAGTQVALFSGVDADASDTATFSLVNPSGLFSIAANGRLTTNQPLNYEAAPTGYSVTVRVTDSGGLWFDESFTVVVTDVNEQPTMSPATFSINENTAAGTAVGTVSAGDPDTNAAFRNFRYEIVPGTGSSMFSINATTGQISLAGSPNYELAPSYSLSVKVWDGGAIGSGLSTVATTTVNIINVNEMPSMSGPTSYTVREGDNGGPGNQLVQTPETGGQLIFITGSDPDGTALQYEIVSGPGIFQINSTTGALMQHGVTDYESPTKSYTLTVRGWDGGAVGVGNSATRTVTINLANVNEAPRIMAAASRTITMIDPFFGSYDELIPGVVVQDPEGDAIQFVHSGGNNWYVQDIPGTALVETHRSEQMNMGLFWMYPVDIYVTARDVNNAESTTLVRYLAGGSAQILGPVALDLDADGVELIAMEDSMVRFDMDNDGQRDHTGWIGADDALLVLDRNGDGMILQGAEISFTGDLAGAQSDLEGLGAFDSDHDGFLDTDDEQFATFQVWRDANQDGFSQASELDSLAAHGIMSIDLTGTPTGEEGGVPGENALTATSEFVLGDGTRGTVGDVLLGYQSLEITATIIETTESAPQEAIPESAPESESEPAPVAAPELPVTDGGRQQRVAIDSWGSARLHGDRWLHGVDPQPVTIDRSSNDPLPASLRPRISPETTDPKFRSAKTEAPRAVEESALQPSTPDETASRDSELQRSAQPNHRRLADWQLSDEDASAPEPEFAARPLVARTALHAELDSITRRRLQMIEAIATFSAEGAADLSLQPQRRVDARTLELLTSVPTVRVA